MESIGAGNRGEKKKKRRAVASVRMGDRVFLNCGQTSVISA